MWQEYGDIGKKPLLRSYFCKLAMSLYIDHDPLKLKRVPNFCRLYKNIDNPEDVKVYKEKNNQGKNLKF
jgi:inositol 1,4,5-triphosphate receptor type 1